MRIAKIDEHERQRIAADIVNAQYHDAGLQRAKFDELCKKYGRKFVQQFYADLVMQIAPEAVPLKIWDWAACNCTEQHHYAAMLAYANKTATDDGIFGIIKNCCLRGKK